MITRCRKERSWIFEKATLGMLVLQCFIIFLLLAIYLLLAHASWPRPREVWQGTGSVHSKKYKSIGI